MRGIAPRTVVAACAVVALAAACTLALRAGRGERGGPPCSVQLIAPAGRALRVEVAADPPSRHRGLAGREALVPGTALALAYPEPELVAVWMHGMRFALDVVWIDGARVVDLREDLPPPAPGADPASLPVYGGAAPADAVVEVPAGTARPLGLVPGARVRWVPAPPAAVCDPR